MTRKLHTRNGRSGRYSDDNHMWDLLKWKDFERADLRGIPLMVASGWDVEFDNRDVLYHRTTYDNVPHNPVAFKKKRWYSWKIIDRNSGAVKWRFASLVNGYFTSHQTFDSLEEVISYEKSIA